LFADPVSFDILKLVSQMHLSRGQLPELFIYGHVYAYTGNEPVRSRTGCLGLGGNHPVVVYDLALLPELYDQPVPRHTFVICLFITSHPRVRASGRDSILWLHFIPVCFANVETQLDAIVELTPESLSLAFRTHSWTVRNNLCAYGHIVLTCFTGLCCEA
jgi:hypothetical protein